MYACVVHGAADLRVDQRPEPVPGPGQIRVAVTHGGICGSDLHYAHDGAVGDFRVRQPMVLGHEVAGLVDALGAGVTEPGPGTPVAVHPATPCDRCPECLAGRRSICRDVRFLGSAARMPHVDGGFAQYLVLPAAQVRPLPPGLDLDRAVLAEPLAVALHGVSRAGGVAGRTVFVTGAGPIGVLVAAAARALGATAVTVSDILDEPLAVARAAGATATVRGDLVDADGSPADPNWPIDPDVVIEASGTASGLASALRTVRRGGVVVQVGMLPPGTIPVTGNLLVTREIDLRGAFRYDAEFDEALALLAGGLDVGAVVTASYPLADAVAAFGIAGDRRQSCKVVLDLTGDAAGAGAGAGAAASFEQAGRLA